MTISRAELLAQQAKDLAAFDRAEAFRQSMPEALQPVLAHRCPFPNETWWTFGSTHYYDGLHVPAQRLSVSGLRVLVGALPPEPCHLLRHGTVGMKRGIADVVIGGTSKDCCPIWLEVEPDGGLKFSWFTTRDGECLRIRAAFPARAFVHRLGGLLVQWRQPRSDRERPEVLSCAWTSGDVPILERIRYASPNRESPNNFLLVLPPELDPKALVESLARD